MAKVRANCHQIDKRVSLVEFHAATAKSLLLPGIDAPVARLFMAEYPEVRCKPPKTSGAGSTDWTPRKAAKLQARGLASARNSGATEVYIAQSSNEQGSNLPSAVTAWEYGTFQHAFDYLNVKLFAGALTQVLITLQRKARTRGYFSAKKFRRRGSDRLQIHEIALNPDGFVGRTDEEILSTLTHEMAHLWQKMYGHVGEGHYHNREWGAKMRSIGLEPSSTGKPGGAETGEHMSHYIIPDGPFAGACREFLERYQLVWESATEPVANPGSGGDGNSGSDPDGQSASTGATTKAQTRTKFTCPVHKCELNAWAKPSALFDCHLCSKETGEQILMVDAEALAAGKIKAHPHPGLSDHDRALRIVSETLQTARRNGLTRDQLLTAMVDFTAAETLKVSGEEGVKALIAQLQKRLEEWRAGKSPAR